MEEFYRRAAEEEDADEQAIWLLRYQILLLKPPGRLGAYQL